MDFLKDLVFYPFYQDVKTIIASRYGGRSSGGSIRRLAKTNGLKQWMNDGDDDYSFAAVVVQKRCCNEHFIVNQQLQIQVTHEKQHQLLVGLNDFISFRFTMPLEGGGTVAKWVASWQVFTRQDEDAKNVSSSLYIYFG